MQRALRRPEGARRARGVPAASPSDADVVIESFRPGVVDRARHRLRRRRRPATRASSTARPAATARTGPRSQWAGHDLNYLAVGGFLDCTGPRRRRAAADPGRDRRRQRGRRHARGDGDPRRARAAGDAPARARTSTSSVADGVLALMALQSTSTSPPASEPGPGHGLLTGRYACYDIYADARRQVAHGRRDRAALLGQPLPARSGSSSGPTHQTDDARAGRDPRRPARRVPHAATATTGSPSSARPTRASRPCCPSPRSSADAQFVARALRRRARTRRTATFRQVGPMFAGMARPTEPYEARDTTVTDTDELLRAAGLADDELAKLRESGVIA